MSIAKTPDAAAPDAIPGETEVWSTWIVEDSLFDQSPSKAYVAIAKDKNNNGVYDDAPAAVPDANGDSKVDRADLRTFGAASDVEVALQNKRQAIATRRRRAGRRRVAQTIGQKRRTGAITDPPLSHSALLTVRGISVYRSPKRLPRPKPPCSGPPVSGSSASGSPSEGSGASGTGSPALSPSM